MSAVAQQGAQATRKPARDPRRIRIVAQVTVTALVALLVGLGAILGGSDSPADHSNVSELGATGPFGGVRYDGGPEEGGHGTVPWHPLPGVRYDGGPEEGSRGSFSISTAPRVRPDGGPEEGTRGPGR
jgi:hypothetical protein